MRDYDPVTATAYLEAADPRLGAVIQAIGPLAMRHDPEDPFHSLMRAIVYQQLSGKAAATIFGRFLALFGDAPGDGPPAIWTATGQRLPHPSEVLALDDETMRSAGLSRAKAASIQDLARYAAAGEITSEHLSALDDEAVITHLVRIRGIGRWSAEMFLLFSLGRSNVLPVNDLGINKAIMQLYELPAMPKPDDVRRIGEQWRPYTSVACWYLWRSLDIVTMQDAPAS